MIDTQVTLTVGRANTSVPTWTRRDQEIFWALCVACRVFTLQQILETWWHPESQRARKRLKLYRATGLLERYQVQACVLPIMAGPVVSWEPGQRVPRNDEEISYRLRSRWTNQLRTTTVYVASQKLADLHGRSSRYRGLPEALQMTHDIGTAQVYLHYRRNYPELAAKWIGEDSVAKKHNTCNPDAWILDDDGFPIQLVDFAGQYSPNRISQLIWFGVNREIGVSLW